ncbi:MAG: hypothetical protein Q8K60_01670 [Parachlamydiaceae bacterium]|nr:hypothetical protein [Parachlamydiaceae bacterium]
MRIRALFLFVFLFFNQTYALNWIEKIKLNYSYSQTQEAQEVSYSDSEETFEFNQKNTKVFGNYHYFKNKEVTKELYDDLTLPLIPNSVTKHQLLSLENLKPCFGLGLSYIFLNIKNEYPIKNRINIDKFGYVIKSGSYVAIRQNLLLDLFLDCYFQKVKLQSSGKDQIGGYRIGGSLGYRF